MSTEASGDAESLVLGAALGLILLVATVSNSLLLLVFYRRPGLRTISNRFVINLLVTNLITCWILAPLMAADSVRRSGAGAAAVAEAAAGGEAATPKVEPAAGDGASGGSRLECALFEGAAMALCAASALSVLMIAVDQYLAVVEPLRYHTAMKATTAALMLLLSWTLAALLGLLGGLGVDDACAWYACRRLRSVPPLLPDAYRDASAAAFLVCAFVAPFAAICRIYLAICSAAHQSHRRTRHRGSATGVERHDAALLEPQHQQPPTIREGERVCSTTKWSGAGNDDGGGDSPVNGDGEKMWRASATPAVPPSSPGPCKPLHHSSTRSSLKSASGSIVNSLRHRISNASVFQYREETRAARVSVLVVATALLCWLPFTVALVLRSPLLGRVVAVPRYVQRVGILSLSAGAVVSPLIFAHRNRRVHRELCRLFGGARQPRFAGYDRKRHRRHSSKRRSPPPPPPHPPVPLLPPPSPQPHSAAQRVLGGGGGSGGDDGCGHGGDDDDDDDDDNDAESVAGHCGGPSVLGRLFGHCGRAVACQSRTTFFLPAAVPETDTSRSSFSSNAGSNQPFASAASSANDTLADEA